MAAKKVWTKSQDRCPKCGAQLKQLCIRSSATRRDEIGRLVYERCTNCDYEHKYTGGRG
jgi:hypothetical protein